MKSFKYPLILFSLILSLLTTQTHAQVTDTGDEVGIGESTPIAKLHISNNGSSLGAVPAFMINTSDNNSPNGYQLIVAGSSTPASPLVRHTQITTGSGDSRLTIKASSQTDFAPRLQMIGPNDVAGGPSQGSAVFDFGSREIDRPGSSFLLRYMATTGAPVSMFRVLANDEVHIAPTDGLVGIGTSAPQSKLHVIGTETNDGVIVEGLPSTDLVRVQLANRNSGGRNYILQSTGGSASMGQGKLSIYDVDAAESRMTVAASGYVGINHDYPLARLHVRAEDSEDPFLVGIDGFTRFKIYANGGTSIGTVYSSTPDQGLYVEGDALMNQKLAVGTTSATDQITVVAPAGSDAMRVKVDNTTRFRVFANGSITMGINNTNLDSTVVYVHDRLHVGTTAGATDYEVAVDGDIICEEVKVQTSGNWPDYVFDDDYKLMPLADLEQSIKENHHLPGIPAAAEVEENGIELGDMQKRLMEKVEELTLYVIELEKKQKSLEQELANLKQ